MLGLKLNHVSKRGPWLQMSVIYQRWVFRKFVGEHVSGNNLPSCGLHFDLSRNVRFWRFPITLQQTALLDGAKQPEMLCVSVCLYPIIISTRLFVQQLVQQTAKKIYSSTLLIFLKGIHR